MRFLLDTNIISNVTKPKPSKALLDWMAEQSDQDLYICALTVAEVCRCVLEKPAGRRRRELESWFSGPEGPQALFAGRVLPFDEKAGLVWAKLMADGKANGRPRSALDTIIAAVAEANDCVVVTDNERDFDGVVSINPINGVTHRDDEPGCGDADPWDQLDLPGSLVAKTEPSVECERLCIDG